MSRTSGYAEKDTVTRKLLRVHWPVIIVVSAIAAIGTAALYSVAGGSFQPWAERHALRYIVALGIVLGLAALRPLYFMRAAYPAYVVSLALLAIVPYVGVEALGAKRWLSLGGISFQPSELMKVALVCALARYYHWLPEARISRPLWVALPALMIAIPVALTLRQPDLGSGVLFASLGFALMFLAGVSAFYFIGAAIAAVGSLPIVWAQLHDYQRRRIEIFINPDQDPLGAGYHITQSKIAIGSGGVSGKGFVQGTQSQLDFVPEKHTDFIATMLGEEWGFAGLLILLALYALVITMLIMMAWQCRQPFGRLLIAGIATTLFVYVFINIAMVTGLVPVVGIPLPLVSYGGTSMTTLMIGLALAMSAHVHADVPIRRDDVGLLI
jgi:rod shape determining protein RodA